LADAIGANTAVGVSRKDINPLEYGRKEAPEEQFMAIDRELFTSLYECLFVTVTMDDGQASKTRSLASRLWGGEDWASTLFATKDLWESHTIQ
jgi:hypothetical protein